MESIYNSKISNKLQNDVGKQQDKTQLKITNFIDTKKNNKEKMINDDKFLVTAVYGEENNKSTEKKLDQLEKKYKRSKKENKKNKNISTQNLINDLNDLEKNGEEYNFEFLNKYEKFDNDTNSIFDLFIAPKQKNDNQAIDKRIDDSNFLDFNKNDKKENNKNNKNSDLMFLNTIEDFTNLL